MNSCQFVGRFLKKPNLKVFEKSSGGNTFVTNFTLEISRIFRKKNGEEREQVNQFDFEAWDVGAKLITDSFDSGDWITVHASAKKESFKDPKTGEHTTRVKFRVNEFEIPKWSSSIESGRYEENKESESARV